MPLVFIGKGGGPQVNFKKGTEGDAGGLDAYLQALFHMGEYGKCGLPFWGVRLSLAACRRK